MSAHRGRVLALGPWVAVGAGCVVLAWLVSSGSIPHEGYAGAGAALVLLTALALAYLAWQMEPAWLLTAAVISSCFNGNWGAFGFPAGFAPDRLLLLAGLAALVLRSRGASERPQLELRPHHVVLGLTLAWAIGSAAAAHTLAKSNAYFILLDRMAVPIAVFVLAPLAFHTARQRQAFLAAFVAFGGYLGATALLEATGPKALVFPHFILDPSFGYHGTRSRGPFLEASVNGIALYVSCVAAAIALVTWTERWQRIAATTVLTLCALGLLFTLTRSVWMGALIATGVTMAATRELRRFMVPVAVGIALTVFVGLAVVPGLDTRVDQRREARRSLWERQNVDAAAVTMVLQRPLVGFGLGTFNERNSDYFTLLADVPQVAERRLAIHNVFLSLATELGLIGVTLFIASLGLAVGSALLSRGPPELRPWRVGLAAITICWLVVACFAPIGQVFPSMIVWLWAGVVLGGCGQPRAQATLDS